MENIESIIEKYSGEDPEKLLGYFLERYGERIAIASSLGAEDQVLTHMALSSFPHARIFIIDTGRLHQETYDTAAATAKKYGVKYELFFPGEREVEEMTGAHGVNLFYDSLDLRKMCCRVRKVGPLKRALSTVDAWITGMRRGQSVTRREIGLVERDDVHGIMKINPLAGWSRGQVWDYIRKNHVPYNRLHDMNFQSIGCAPCTRATGAHEDERAGRWWWEEPEHRECGLHTGGHAANTGEKNETSG